MSTIKLTDIDTVDAACPYVSEDMTRYETQEIRSDWSAILYDLDDAIGRIVNVRERIANGANVSPQNILGNAAQALTNANIRIGMLHRARQFPDHRRSALRSKGGVVVAQIDSNQVDDFVTRYGEAEDAPVAMRIATALKVARDAE